MTYSLQNVKNIEAKSRLMILPQDLGHNYKAQILHTIQSHIPSRHSLLSARKLNSIIYHKVNIRKHQLHIQHSMSSVFSSALLFNLAIVGENFLSFHLHRNGVTACNFTLTLVHILTIIERHQRTTMLPEQRKGSQGKQ